MARNDRQRPTRRQPHGSAHLHDSVLSKFPFAYISPLLPQCSDEPSSPLAAVACSIQLQPLRRALPPEPRSRVNPLAFELFLLLTPATQKKNHFCGHTQTSQMEYGAGPSSAGKEKDMYGNTKASDTSSGYGSAPGYTSTMTPCHGEPEVGEVRHLNEDVLRQKEQQGEANFRRLGWKRLTIVLIVEAIALGSLSLPHAFATLGMVAGIICSISIGLIAIYTAYVVGQVKLKYPEVAHYADAGRLMFGKWGYEIVGAMFVMQLVFVVSSHVLTGKIMWSVLTDNGNGTCSIVFGIVSAILLFLVAIPPSFAELAILGYIDFASILAAIGITIVATGIKGSELPGGLSSVNWSAWPKPGTNLAEAFIALCNIALAYSFAMCQFSFMEEMHTPAHYTKSIVALGGIEIIIYTVTGALVYSFVGMDVKAPALLSAGPLISKVAFGVALPVIFISGSINTVVIAKYILNRACPNSVVRYVNTTKGWIVWISLDAIITLVSWIIAESIPFFSDLLAITSALFISGFTFYLPALMWFTKIREGGMFDRKNLFLTVLNGTCFVVGIIVLVLGTYASVWGIVSFQSNSCFQCMRAKLTPVQKENYQDGSMATPFSCGY